MNTIISLAFISISFIGFRQLEGKYILEWNGFVSEEITFNKDGTFEYDYSGCTQLIEGKGKFHMKGRHLTLNFITPKDSVKYISKIDVKRKPTKKDNINIELQLSDKKTKEALMFAYVVLKDKSNNHYIAEVSTDLEGKAILFLPKSDDTLSLVATSIGCTDTALDIVPNQDYDIKISMFHSIKKPMKTGDKIEFVIKRNTQKGLLMSRNWKKRYYGMYYKPEYWKSPYKKAN